MTTPDQAFHRARLLIDEARAKGYVRLELGDLPLREVPHGIGQLRRLVRLGLQNSELTSLPAELGNLFELQVLDISGNTFSELPDVVCRLKGLTSLSASGNHLVTVPPSLAQLVHLQNLDLANNELEDFPEAICALQNLEQLDLSDNKLRSLSNDIGKLSFMKALFLRNNQLRILPPEIGDLANLLTLALQGNPLGVSLSAAFERSTDDTKAFLRSLRDGEQVYEAKLVFLGEGGTGKSSLLAALLGERFKDGRPTTHGVEIKTMTLKHPTVSTDITLNCWDFGGQQVYRVTHQFFYSRRSLYVLCWRPRQGVRQNDIDGWLRQIRLRIGIDARVLIVATHFQTDEHLAQIDKNQLRQEYGQLIAGFFEVDSKTGFGIELVRNELRRIASELPQMGDWISKSWKEARNELLKTKATHIPFSMLYENCNQRGFTKETTRTFAKLLHDLGHIVYFDDDPELSDFVVLRPQWLSQVIGHVLEDAVTNEHHGVLQHVRLREIWNAYEIGLHPYFLRLMEKFDASYRVDNYYSLVGELVPEIRPVLPWEPRSTVSEGLRQLSVVFIMDEDPPGLVPWFIVRNHRYNDKRLHWQKGVYLEDTRFEHGSAVVELVDRELWITVRSRYPSHLMSLLSDSVMKLVDERWVGLRDKYRLAVPCPERTPQDTNCRGRFELDALYTFRGEGDEQYRCQACRKRLSINQLLTGFAPTSAEQRHVEVLQRLRKADLQRSNIARSAMADRKKYASVFAELLRLALRMLSTETRECPRLFMLTPTSLKGWRQLSPKRVLDPKTWTQRRFRLNLWCEMPGEEHPISPLTADRDNTDVNQGEYYFERPRAWFLRIAPLMNFVARTLKLALPVTGATANVFLHGELVEQAIDKLALMEALSDIMIRGSDHQGQIAINRHGGFTAEGAALREFHSLLLDLDPGNTWGKLRRILTKSGDFLWVCPEHFQDFEPGLPDFSKL